MTFYLYDVLSFCDARCSPRMFSILKLSSLDTLEAIVILRKNKLVRELESRLKVLAVRMLGDMVMQYHLQHLQNDEFDDSISLSMFLDQHHLHFLFW